MTIKKTFSALAVLLIMAFAGSELLARDGYQRGKGRGYHGNCGGPGYGRYHHLDFLQKEIGLTDAQVEKIIRLDADYRIKYHRNRKSPDKLRSLRDQYQKDFDKILTKKQKEKIKKFRTDGNGRRGYHHRRGTW